MKKDKRLENITLSPSATPLINQETQLTIICEALAEVLDGHDGVIRRVPFSEDYRGHSQEI